MEIIKEKKTITYEISITEQELLDLLNTVVHAIEVETSPGHQLYNGNNCYQYIDRLQNLRRQIQSIFGN